MKVVIGAGPAGLYTAIRLRKEGIRDIVIYDPRAGSYTRPGHLNRPAFIKAERGIDVRFELRAGELHIKDLERALFKEAIKLGIRIENKSFVKLLPDARTPGVIIADKDGKEEFVPADFVFDCSGGRRIVVNAVNDLSPELPFKLTTITELPITNHFLAYVKMAKEQWVLVNSMRDFDLVFSYLDPLSYAKSIIKLRAMGWNELRFPRYYGASFGKGKVCLYLHAPDHLPEEHYDLWVQTVLEAYIAPVTFTHVPPSKKYPSKPRFGAFSMGARELDRVSYKGKDLPTVVALGDTQIDFDYASAHGIADGIDRINSLIEHMEFLNGDIAYFDADDYLRSIKEQLQDHKREITEQAIRARKRFADVLAPAKAKLSEAYALTEDGLLKKCINELITEIEGRQAYLRGREVFFDCHHEEGTFKVGTVTTNPRLGEKLFQIQLDLVKALSVLTSPLFVSERAQAELLMGQLAVSLKKVGDDLYKAGKGSEAITAYQKVIEIYQIPSLSNKDMLMRLHSNLAIACNKEKRYADAITAAKTALALHQALAGVGSVSVEKIIFNLITALCAQGQVFIASNNQEEAQALCLSAVDLITRYESLLLEPTIKMIKIVIEELQHDLHDSFSHAVIVPPISIEDISTGGALALHDCTGASAALDHTGASAALDRTGVSAALPETGRVLLASADANNTVLQINPKRARSSDTVLTSADGTSGLKKGKPFISSEALAALGLFAGAALGAIGIGVAIRGVPSSFVPFK